MGGGGSLRKVQVIFWFCLLRKDVYWAIVVVNTGFGDSQKETGFGCRWYQCMATRRLWIRRLYPKPIESKDHGT